MRRSQKIARHLPELRRYAHALLGSRQSGDAQLRVMLECLLQSPGELRDRSDLRRELFRFFHTVVHTLRLPLEGPLAKDEVPERRLRDAVASLSLRGREVLLLTSVAGFDTAETAEVLGITKKGVHRELDHAREHMRRRLSARILIVEDEGRAAGRLEHVVEELGHSVVGVVPPDEAAVDAARRERPELVLADMHHDDAAVEDHIRATLDAPVVSVRPPQPRRASSRRAASRDRGKRHVTPRNIGDAISEALVSPMVVKTNALTRG